MSHSYRLGVLGAGGIGTTHAEAATRAGSIVAAVWDPDPARAATFAAQFPRAVTPATLDEFLSLGDLDAVIVAAPNAVHEELAIAAMDAGHHVLLEKPMATSVDGCRRILEARDRTGRHLQLGFVTRFAGSVIAARDSIRAGAIGRPYHIRAQLLRRRGIPGLGGWFTTRALAGGGVLVDLGVHLLDLALDLTGRPQATRVSGSCSSIFGPRGDRYVYEEMWAGPPRPGGTFDVEDGAIALIRFGRDLTMELSVAWASDLPEEVFPVGLMLLGDAGGCWIEPWNGRAIFGLESGGELIDREENIPPSQGSDVWSDAWTEQHRHFADILAERHAPTARGEHGLEVQAILEAIYRSSDEGCEVEVVIPTESAGR